MSFISDPTKQAQFIQMTHHQTKSPIIKSQWYGSHQIKNSQAPRDDFRY